MSGAEIDSQPLLVDRETTVEPKTGRLFGILEASGFFVLALVLCCAQTFWSGSPLLTLLFDSSGYLWVAEGLQQCANSGVAQGLYQYFSSGGSETARVMLCQQLAPMADICKTGPVLPVMTAAWYALVGKPAIAQHWPVAATLTCFLSAVIAPLLYLWGKRLAGPGTGRIAGLLAATYPAFLVNSGRLLSEIPAIAICTAALFVVSVICEKLINRLQELPPRPSVLSTLGSGITVGGCAGLVMLARPPLVLLPFVLCVTLPLLYTWCLRRWKRDIAGDRGCAPPIRPTPKVVAVFLSGVVCGAACLLAPWATVKTILTGKPSITVDRYGAYNLYAGCSVSNDGWDVLPSVFVTHPERFEKSIPQVAASVAAEAVAQPGQFVDLMLRKPGRLIATPWNDFQTACLGVPWYLQRFWQQFLLLAAFFGLISIAAGGVIRRDTRLLIFTGIAGTAITYHLVNDLFITMSRYFVVCMPLILLCGAKLLDDVAAARVRHRDVMMLALFLFPTISTAGAIILADEACIANISGVFKALSFPAVFSVVITSALAASLILGCRENSNARFLRLPVSILMALLTMCCLCSSRDYAAEVGTIIRTDAGKPLTLVANNCSVGPDAAVAPGAPASSLLQGTDRGTGASDANVMRWFVVADIVGHSADKDLSVLFNDRQIGGDWTPLWSRMPAARENLTYLAAFAYSAGKQIDDIKQWSCIEVPPSAVSAQTNTVVIEQPGNVFRCDFNDADHGFRRLSLEKFSWSKGFFADMPGEMRVLEPSSFSPDRVSDLERMVSHVVPRAFLIAVPGPQGLSENPVSARLDFALPPQIVGRSAESRLKSVELTEIEFDPPADSALARIHVSAKVRTVKGPGKASLCLVERVRSNGSVHEEFAPGAPQTIETGPEWTSFHFDDFVPVSPNDRLESLKLLFAGRPWWEVLSYNNTKGKTEMEFSDVRVTVSTVAGVDLTKARVFPLARKAK